MRNVIQSLIARAYYRIKVDTRERLNPYLAPYRYKKLTRLGGTEPFTIISNNCWGGHVYRFFGLPYNSPTVGLFFFAHDYIKFVSDLKRYLTTELQFITLEESKYCKTLKEYGGECVECPIALCGDIEIIFMHYKTPEEAREKWVRRTERMNWDNLIIKYSEMNGCTEEDLKSFDSLPYQKKVAFVTRDYGLKSQAIFKQYLGKEKIDNDTDNFRKYINLYDLISGRFNKRKK